MSLAPDAGCANSKFTHHIGSIAPTAPTSEATSKQCTVVWLVVCMLYGCTITLLPRTRTMPRMAIIATWFPFYRLLFLPRQRGLLLDLCCEATRRRGFSPCASHHERRSRCLWDRLSKQCHDAETAWRWLKQNRIGARGQNPNCSTPADFALPESQCGKAATKSSLVNLDRSWFLAVIFFM